MTNWISDRPVAADGADNDAEDETKDPCSPDGQNRAGSLREQVTMADLAQLPRSSKPDLRLEEAAFGSSGAGLRERQRRPATEHEREIERLHSKIGQLIVERDFFLQRGPEDERPGPSRGR